MIAFFRPDRFGRQLSPYDNVVLSYSSIRATLRTLSTERHALGIDFRDVSTRQQLDVSSCGLFALENSRVIHEQILLGNLTTEAVRSALAAEDINTSQLRRQFAEELATDRAPPAAGVQEVQVQPQRHGEPAGRGREDDVAAAAQEDGHQPAQEAPVHPVLEIVPQPQGPNSDGTNLEQSFEDFKRDRTVGKFINLMIAYLTNIHDYHGEIFDAIWDTVKIIETLPHDSMKQIENAFCFILDLVEEQGDPLSHSINFNEKPPYEFLEDLLRKAKDLFGFGHSVVLKISLLLIFNSKDGTDNIEQFIEEGGTSKQLRESFSNGTPRPTTGTFIDTNGPEDPIRDIRYYAIIGMVMRAQRKYENAMKAFNGALQWSRQAEVDSLYAERRGVGGAVDLAYASSRILREAADLNQACGNSQRALSYLAQAAEKELLYRIKLNLPPQYVAYLKFITLNPDFSLEGLKLFLARYQWLPAMYVGGFTTYLKARAILEAKDGKVKVALGLLQEGLAYLKHRLENINASQTPEGAFDALVERSIFQLAVTRMNIRVMFATKDVTNTLEACAEVIMNVREFCLEDCDNDSYRFVLRKFVEQLGLLNLDHSQDPEIQATFRKVSQEMLAEYTKYHLSVEEDFQEVAENFYSVIASNCFKHGDLANFILHMFNSGFASSLVRKETADVANKDDLYRKLHVVVKKILMDLSDAMPGLSESELAVRERACYMLFQMYQKLLTLIQSKVSILGEGQSNVRSLKLQAHHVIISSSNDQIGHLKRLLASIAACIARVTEQCRGDFIS